MDTVIERVSDILVPTVLPLMRQYCDFYKVEPSDEDLAHLSRTLAADSTEGIQLLAVQEGQAVGFATIFWSWSTLSAGRIGVMNDLYVCPQSRGEGVAEALISACRDECSARGARTLAWQTALDNLRAQAVYDRVGALRETWLDYSLPAD
jgi:GNAT superfamily N-acetyltransferase